MSHKLILIVLAICISASWCRAQTRALDSEFATEWLLLGPFPSTKLDRDFLASIGGEANVRPEEGDHFITAPGDTLRWKRYQSQAGTIDFDYAIGIAQNWKYRPGDNPDWAVPEFDDRAWETTRSWFRPISPPKSGWTGIGWFRLHLAVDSTLWNRTLALHVKHWGASEIYLDGKLLAQFGKVGSSHFGFGSHFLLPYSGISSCSPLLPSQSQLERGWYLW